MAFHSNMFKSDGSQHRILWFWCHGLFLYQLFLNGCEELKKILGGRQTFIAISCAHFCFLGSQIHNWFNFQSMVASITLKVPPESFNNKNLVGFAFFVIVSFRNHHDCYLGVQICVNAQWSSACLFLAFLGHQWLCPVRSHSFGKQFLQRFWFGRW